MIDTTNARLVFSSLTRGGENLKRAVASVRGQWQRGEISMEEYQRQADCARSLGVKQNPALRAWNAGCYLGA